jgi:hypothetical protein
MKTCEELTQQSGLLHHWLEAIPFTDYHGWQIRACPEGSGWVWEIAEPPEFGSSYFESGEIYPNRSRALLSARRLILRLSVSQTLAPALEELCDRGAISTLESNNLLHSVYDDRHLISP